jgi:alpha-galactosidase
MWDELVGRHPGLPIDNCASGGRRIDLETISRSYALWRSDFQDVGILSRPDYLGVAAIASQVQTVGLGLYVPFSTSALWSFDPYSFRSTMCCGVPAYLDLRDESLNRDQARAAIAELKELRPYFLGDLYPLMAISTSSSDWCAYQFDRPDLGEGMALFFRRHESPYLSVEARLEALDPKATYQYTVSSDYKTPKPKRASGAELAVMPIEIGEAPGCALLRYRELK